ncbi:AlbA family DNA-binding domain-containing protein [Sediminitomix flava]|uniref:Putative DNA-binding protein n=1 Tax=Sediminitomix flava TaxID=379075 RepID=A0A315ZGI0_SEDFL|nr:ATP-binding protein [Sediminitomix flava]PWJ44259.1 putative DNA-binding protein [Sediminitomix flava]
MSDKNLYRLISKGESQTLDFKRTLNDVYKIAKSLTSFANTKGGVLLIGVEDNGKISGVDPEEEAYLIKEAANFYCDPPVNLKFEETLTDEGKTVLMVIVPNSKLKPHKSLTKKGDWTIYTRMYDKSILASEGIIDRMESDVVEDEPVLYTLSPQEESLIDYLGIFQRITLKGYANLVNFSERRARRSLMTLIKEGLVAQHDIEKTPFFTLA